MRRYAAHLHTASAGDRSCGKVEGKQLRRLFCVLAVHLEEIAHLKQHDVVRVGFLDGIVVGLCLCWQFTLCFLFPLKLGVTLLFPWREEAVLLNEAVNPCDHLRPAQLYIGAVCLFQRNSAAVVILAAVGCTGNGVGAPAYAVLIFEESCLFLAGMVGGEVFVDPALAALDAAAAVKGVVDLVLRDEAPQLRHCGHFGGIFSAWQGHIPQALPDVLQLVVMEAQQTSVLLMGGVKLCELAGERFTEICVCQLLRQPRRFIRESAAPQRIHAGEIALFPRLVAQVVFQIPEGLCKLHPLMLPCLGKLHIGGIRAAFHKLGNTRGGVLPCNYLRAAHILRTSAGSDVDAVYGVPRGKLALRRLKAVAAVEGALQQRGNGLHRLLLLERGGNDHAGIVRVAAQPQHMVKLLLRNGKSEGRLRNALRFFDRCNLFRFGGEKG